MGSPPTQNPYTSSLSAAVNSSTPHPTSPHVRAPAPGVSTSLFSLVPHSTSTSQGGASSRHIKCGPDTRATRLKEHKHAKKERLSFVFFSIYGPTASERALRPPKRVCIEFRLAHHNIAPHHHCHHHHHRRCRRCTSFPSTARESHSTRPRSWCPIRHQWRTASHEQGRPGRAHTRAGAAVRPDRRNVRTSARLPPPLLRPPHPRRRPAVHDQLAPGDPRVARGEYSLF